ncbi:hypothetical protein JQC92_03565 [Shewanella sp. 202IG2-18]|uniref:hypothetical protein n=1 Tax=Parashewanella hymeniacidonis TaxID=2807618 RepID=UPI00195F4B5E|nr:hypothetical protein [Parashewanella hymeniacidonis]MBM7071122.1 hypothetical protein [Parashewanella hymeniacidonis]
MKKKLSALAFGILLAGCGGSGGGKEEKPPQGVNPTTPVVTAEVKFTSSCEVEEPAEGIRFIAHGADGSIIDEIKTDSEGKVSIPWDGDKKHLTIAFEEDDGGATQVTTRLELSEGDLGVQRIYRSNLDEQCECKTLSFDISDIENQLFNTDLYLENRKYQDGDTRTICKTNGRYPLISFSAVSQDSSIPPRSNTLDYNNYPDEPTRVRLDSSMFFADISRSSMLDVNYISSSLDVRKRTFAETRDGRKAWLKWDEQPYIFPNLYENNFVTGGLFEYVESSDNGDIYYSSQRRKRVGSTAGTITIEVPENQSLMLEKTVELLVALTEDSQITYDFTDIGAGRSLVSLNLSLSNGASWQVRSPLSGVLPDLELPEDVKSAFEATDSADFYLTVFGYHSGLNANEFRRKTAEINRMNLEVRSSFYDNYEEDTIYVFPN